MEMNEYQKLAMRTDDPQKYNSGLNRLINALMGLNGEAGEAIDLLKKALFQGHELEKDKLIEELGDNLWYLAEAADTIVSPTALSALPPTMTMCNAGSRLRSRLASSP